jgi:hypothetical protein
MTMCSGIDFDSTRTSAMAPAGHLRHRLVSFSRNRTMSGYPPRLAVFTNHREI